MSLYLEEKGNLNGPTVVLLHGGGIAGWMWQKQWEALDKYHCLIPDLPDHGNSRAEGAIDIEDCAERIAALISERANGGRAHLIGHSLGGKIIVQLLATHPELIDRAIVEEPPFSVREGGISKKGYHPEVDELRLVVNDGKSFIAKIEAEEREKTGIKNLKIGFNKVFGYYIEVTRSYLELVPDTYIRKQTLANCERYITQDLKELENKILSAREKITGLEYELFSEIRNMVAASIHRIQATASSVAQLDVLCSLSEVAAK